MAQAYVSASLCVSLMDASASRSVHPRALPRILPTKSARIASSFLQGSPLLISRISTLKSREVKASSVTIKCEQSTKDSSGLDVWLGRFAMIGFASAITVEIATGKGLLENFGLTAPVPTLALAVTGLVGVLTAVFIFQSASKD